MLTNGVLSGQITLPKQVVRLRILNAELERGYNLGFSDNRTFYVIGNDGGLLNAPVAVTRLPVHVGERYEVLVNLSNETVGGTLDLKAYNTGQTFGFPGAETATSGNFGSLLNNKDFNVLRINIGAATTAITTIPTTLANNTYLTAADATVNQTLSITGGVAGGAFTFDNTAYVETTINKTLTVDTTQKWTVTNTQIFGLAFHIHDVQFKIISRSTGAVGAYESGWKDSFFIAINETVSFVCKFKDYADATHPFMYHCHYAQHEDAGTMGQFVVTGTPLGNETFSSSTKFKLYPNPTNDKLFLSLNDSATEIYYITITTVEGRIVMMLPQPQWQNGIDVSSLAAGTYLLKMMDKETKSITTKKFIKN